MPSTSGTVNLRRPIDGGQSAAGVSSACGVEDPSPLVCCSGEQKSVIVLTIDPLDGTCRPFARIGLVTFTVQRSLCSRWTRVRACCLYHVANRDGQIKSRQRGRPTALCLLASDHLVRSL